MNQTTKLDIKKTLLNNSRSQKTLLQFVQQLQLQPSQMTNNIIT